MKYRNYLSRSKSTSINSINSIYLDEPVKLNTQGMKRP